MVDEGMIDKDPSWGYTNQDGEKEYVSIYETHDSHVISISDSDVYIKDVHKLVLALQAAYDFIKENT